MRFLAYSFFAFFLALGVSARAEFKVPTLTGPVMDEVGYLSRNDRQELMQLLYDFNKRGVAQVQVLIVPTLDGMPIEMASIAVTDKWKLGDEKKDNGVLFLIAANDRKLRIEVGQGLEGAIPDVIASRIIRDQVVPLFRARQFSAGIVLGTHEILRLADKEFAEQNGLQEGVPAKSDRDGSGGDIPIGVIIILFIIISILGRFGGGRGRHLRGGGWGGGYGGGGGWSSGGGGGGGWSGGGGGFSGGGSSGSW
ncbi:TPM domain-containing protein [Bdellovibrio bacteriovorus]|uniref:Hypothetical membrane spanning protein n=1 Tax=Bdellovibrio bacteriovorus (strain ATCC 15356 / DSM 50701 / NCIMB 9529 / HD100) TaxID=264462 RepID=Q6MNN6_BDEBA|nr:TPM domain-containing protein [Bdellovibrio bacteriovorus]AHZ86424.1 hypothetical protein EP01_15995 [Bdellovibrio bacteriovorus]BEV67665.1 hypothetical protein Bb109J_c1085 [Bdellovibrio bacteriovorus]CAE79115.1 hypothetical membrane spanning protein [Bdellovibrio bacteriovorus HD100]